MSSLEDSVRFSRFRVGPPLPVRDSIVSGLARRPAGGLPTPPG